MLASKEKLEDLRWREELLGFVKGMMWRYNETGDKKYIDLAKEAGEESKKIQHRLQTHDYAPKQLARQQHFNEVGPHDCARYD
ncbi:MAG: hypothetical protein WC822_06455 [Candidatus Paceibacterota bacterium]|jgi:hypothetical protein